jgi:hypothetical protein
VDIEPNVLPGKYLFSMIYKLSFNFLCSWSI